MNEISMPDWVTSDQHWLHKNISKYSARTTPLIPTPEEVDELMRYNWRELVKPADTILHLGDIGFLKPTKQYDWLKELPGIKYFVRGNHDKFLSPTWLYHHGFIEIDAPTIIIDGKEILFTHYPQKNLKPNQYNVHGHVHVNPVNTTNRHINVCVELWHYAPVSCSFIVDKLLSVKDTNAGDNGPETIKYRGDK